MSEDYDLGKSEFLLYRLMLIPLSEIVRSPFSVREGSDLTDLTRSIEEIGVAEPIIVRKNNDGKYELVAGERRYSASKAAGLKEIPAILRSLTCDEQAFTIQSIENLHRTDLTDSEKTALVTSYAERFQKKPKEIAKILGMGYDWVLKYLPARFKDQVKAEAGQQGGLAKAIVLDSVKQTVKTQDTPQELDKAYEEGVKDALTLTKSPNLSQLVECERCHVNTSEAKPWPEDAEQKDQHLLCPKCFERALLNPDQYKGFFHYRDVKPRKVEAKPAKPQETAEFRLGRMHPQKSKIELKIVEGLRLKGYKVTTDVAIVVKQTATTPDFNIELESGKMVRGYIDGVVHNGKIRDKDDDLRALLRKVEPNSLIVPVDVKGDSDSEVQAKLKEIEEALKF